MTSRGLKSRFGRMISLANTGEQIDKKRVEMEEFHLSEMIIINTLFKIFACSHQ